MRVIIFSNFICLFFQISIAQNFIGEIKYAATSTTYNLSDTLTYFFDDNIVLIKSGKGTVTYGGPPYEIYVLSEDKHFLFNNQNNVWSELIINPNMQIKASVPDSIGIESFLNHTCILYEIKDEISNEILRTSGKDIIWVSEDFIFKKPRKLPFTDRIFANDTGRIALKIKTKALSTSKVGVIQEIDASITAISISPGLSEEYKT